MHGRPASAVSRRPCRQLPAPARAEGGARAARAGRDNAGALPRDRGSRDRARPSAGRRRSACSCVTDGEFRRAVVEHRFPRRSRGLRGLHRRPRRAVQRHESPRRAVRRGRQDRLLRTIRCWSISGSCKAHTTVDAEDDDPVAGDRCISAATAPRLERSIPIIERYFDDFAAAYRKARARLLRRRLPLSAIRRHRLGASVRPEQRDLIRGLGDDPDRTAGGLCAHDQRALAGPAADMMITTHVCRGNFRSTWVSEGGYEPVAEMLFGGLEYDGYFLEYDTERAGGFEPLRFLPKGTSSVVLGLVTSKSGALETRTTSSAGSTRRRKYRRSRSALPVAAMRLRLDRGRQYPRPRTSNGRSFGWSSISPRGLGQRLIAPEVSRRRGGPIDGARMRCAAARPRSGRARRGAGPFARHQSDILGCPDPGARAALVACCASTSAATASSEAPPGPVHDRSARRRPARAARAISRSRGPMWSAFARRTHRARRGLRGSRGVGSIAVCNTRTDVPADFATAIAQRNQLSAPRGWRDRRARPARWLAPTTRAQALAERCRGMLRRVRPRGSSACAEAVRTAGSARAPAGDARARPVRRERAGSRPAGRGDACHAGADPGARFAKSRMPGISRRWTAGRVQRSRCGISWPPAEGQGGSISPRPPHTLPDADAEQFLAAFAQDVRAGGDVLRARVHVAEKRCIVPARNADAAAVFVGELAHLGDRRGRVIQREPEQRALPHAAIAALLRASLWMSAQVSARAPVRSASFASASPNCSWKLSPPPGLGISCGRPLSARAHLREFVEEAPSDAERETRCGRSRRCR